MTAGVSTRYVHPLLVHDEKKLLRGIQKFIKMIFHAKFIHRLMEGYGPLAA